MPRADLGPRDLAVIRQMEATGNGESRQQAVACGVSAGEADSRGELGEVVCLRVGEGSDLPGLSSVSATTAVVVPLLDVSRWSLSHVSEGARARSTTSPNCRPSPRGMSIRRAPTPRPGDGTPRGTCSVEPQRFPPPRQDVKSECPTSGGQCRLHAHTHRCPLRTQCTCCPDPC